eukprot:3656662-Prymnesium_polylepis.1
MWRGSKLARERQHAFGCGPECGLCEARRGRVSHGGRGPSCDIRTGQTRDRLAKWLHGEKVWRARGCGRGSLEPGSGAGVCSVGDVFVCGGSGRNTARTRRRRRRVHVVLHDRYMPCARVTRVA